MLPGKKFTIDDVWRILRERSWIVIVSVLACAFATLLVSRFLPNVYQAETLIQIVPQRIPDSYVRSTVTTAVDDRLKSIQQQIQSRTRLEETINEFNLYPAERQRGSMEDALARMRDRIMVELVTGPPRRGERPIEAFRVRFTDETPALAARVTERLASWFIDENARLRGTQADTTNEFIDSQLLEAKRRLETQEQKVQAFRERNSGRLPDQLDSNLQAIQNLQMQVQAQVESVARDRDRKLMLERLHADAVVAEMAANAAPVTPPPAGSGNAVASGSPRQQLETTRAMLAQAEARLTPEHPDIKRLQRQIADLEKKVAAEPASPSGTAPLSANDPNAQHRRERISGLKAEMESLTRQIAFKEREEGRLRALMASYQGRIEAVPGVESEWVALNRDYQTQRDSYETLLKKSDESKVAANLERQQIGEQFRVLDPARIPSKPLSPNRLLLNLGGLAAGFVIGLGLIGLLEFFADTYRTEADVVSALALPVIAVVPYAPTTADRHAATKRRRLLAATGTAALLLATGTAVVLQLWRYLV